MTNLNNLIDLYLKRKEFKFKNGKLLDNENKIILDVNNNNKSKNYTIKKTDINL